MSDFYELTVKEVISETADAKSIIFDIPTDLKDTFTYKAGQYLTLSFDINGKEERRAYSMSSSPLEDNIKVSVKRVFKGIVSNHINENIRSGQKVRVMPPAGRFVVDEAVSATTFYLIGGGSGITPLLSIAKTVLEDKSNSDVRLLYGNKDEDNIIFHSEIDALASQYGDRFKVDHILAEPKKIKKKGIGGMFSKAKTNWAGWTGMPTSEVLTRFLDKHTTTKASLFYICGPGAMMDTAEQYLLSKGYDDSIINLERFSSPNDSKPAAAASSDATASTIKVTLKGETFDVFIPAGKTVLDSLLAAGKVPPFSCMTGACSTCCAKLESGTVDMENCFGLDNSDIEKGYILTCQASPTSNDVAINYDNI